MYSEAHGDVTPLDHYQALYILESRLKVPHPGMWRIRSFWESGLGRRAQLELGADHGT